MSTRTIVGNNGAMSVVTFVMISLRAGNCGNVDNAASSTFLQLTDNERNAGIAASATNPRDLKLWQRRPQMYSIVCERLNATNPSSPATVSWHIRNLNLGI